MTNSQIKHIKSKPFFLASFADGSVQVKDKTQHNAVLTFDSYTKLFAWLRMTCQA